MLQDGIKKQKTNKQTNKQTSLCTDGQTDRHTDTHTDRHTHTQAEVERRWETSLFLVDDFEKKRLIDPTIIPSHAAFASSAVTVQHSIIFNLKARMCYSASILASQKTDTYLTQQNNL